MSDVPSTVSKWVVQPALSLSLTALPIFFPDIVPSANYSLPQNEDRTSYQPHGESLSTQYANYVERGDFNVAVLLDFASRLIQESQDIPPDFARVINEEFWNLL